ncbi:MAG: hypothetical protein LKI58_02520 [Actinomyces sp.]|nr:hypothetical protein [Actinomyces sp.]MCI1640915.1 hypothetical protein [Actinomyces sp.]MCI1661283.1 hypothetical protein [Actinomyces sp.]MCI1690291.1 hypothetical protein [Actinomyces sp.]MCI1786932.1 hypothetical protein [Actinomyces sp.]MCI1829502.1 hypothetical protein [Actinomyces sp.]
MDLDLYLADLEGRFDAERRMLEEALVGELTDAERAGVSLAARLLARSGERLTVLVRGGGRLSGRVKDVARTWVLLATPGGDSLIPLTAVAAVWPLGASAVDESSVRHAVGVGHILRELAEDAAEVVIDHDAGIHQGTVRAVFADHLDIETRAGASGLDTRDRGAAEVISLPTSGIRRLRLITGPR